LKCAISAAPSEHIGCSGDVGYIFMFPTSFRSIHFVLELTYSYRIGFFPNQLPAPLAAGGVVLFPPILGQHLTCQQTPSVFEGNGRYGQFAFSCESSNFKVRT
jgi:hypothetical protein